MAEYFLDAKKNEIIFSICHMPPVLIYMKITLDTNKRSNVLQSKRTTFQRATLAESSRCRGIKKYCLAIFYYYVTKEAMCCAGRE